MENIQESIVPRGKTGNYPNEFILTVEYYTVVQMSELQPNRTICDIQKHNIESQKANARILSLIFYKLKKATTTEEKISWSLNFIMTLNI